MNVSPARVMGVFLRTWRAEWAGLSRAVLAGAVGSQCPGETVTGDMAYAWERGQPPRTTAQLLALERVMRKHGLTEGHVRQFREVVLAACGAWRYEGLCEDVSFADLPGVEGLARSACERQHRARGSISLCFLTILAKDLEAAVRADLLRRIPRARERERQAALAYARAALACELAADQLRWVPAATRLWLANAEFIETHFGPAGLGGRLTPLGQRIAAAWSQAHPTLSEADGRRLLQLSEAAASRGQRREAARAFLRGVHALGEASAGAYTALAPAADRQLHAAMEEDGRSVIHVGHLDLAWAALGGGDADGAERMLRSFEEWCRAPWRADAWWQEARWWVLAELGDYREAARFVAATDPPLGPENALVRLSEMGLRGKPTAYASHCRNLRRDAVRVGLQEAGAQTVAPEPQSGPTGPVE